MLFFELQLNKYETAPNLIQLKGKGIHRRPKIEKTKPKKKNMPILFDFILNFYDLLRIYEL